MDSLPERIEAAEGPSRELDAEIAVSVLGMERDGSIFFGKDEDFVLERDYYSIEGSARELPAYTASIDAAMTLVPEGYALGFKRAPCQRSHAMLATIGYEANASGATPALALCAAALRAKEQPNEG